MLPYTVNSPRSYKGKSGKERQSSSVWCVGLLICLFAAAGGVWYLQAHSAYVRNLVAVITEHGENSLNCKTNMQLVCHVHSRWSSVERWCQRQLASAWKSLHNQGVIQTCMLCCRNKI